MSQLTCFMCGYQWKSKHREHNPKVCPSCGNPNWKSPTLAVRFLAAWRAFQNPFLVKTIARRVKCCESAPDVAEQSSTLSTTPVTYTDPDGLPYTARLV